MISIPKTVGNGIAEPSRGFTEQEQITIDGEGGVIAQWGDEDNCWFFTAADETNNTSDWQAYQVHLANVQPDPPTSTHLVGLLLSALEVATPDEKQDIRTALGI
jgi:hypothetical protein